MTPDKPIIPGLKRRAVMIIVLLLAGLAALMLLPEYLQQNSAAVELTPQPCDLHTGVCEGILDDKRVRLSITPGPLHSMKPLQVMVQLDGINAQAVLLDIQGRDMYMGINQTQLQSPVQTFSNESSNKSSNEISNGHDNWNGKTELAVCTTGEMFWRAQLIINDDTTTYTTWFDFSAH
ncbi:hypothetical protein [Nitrincola sp. MINF-07-Sa-05]|uniref:hypothetical protein n=1 Tax=Nitrincola salilacus TaxID=3400273 RepID=UPI0039180F10